MRSPSTRSRSCARALPACSSPSSRQCSRCGVRLFITLTADCCCCVLLLLLLLLQPVCSIRSSFIECYVRYFTSSVRHLLWIRNRRADPVWISCLRIGAFYDTNFTINRKTPNLVYSPVKLSLPLFHRLFCYYWVSCTAVGHTLY